MQTLRLFALLIAVILLFSCRSGNHYEGQRTEEMYQQYRALNDSMQHLSPHALPMIQQQMQQADDSLTWYDYYLMYGRHYLLSDKPDSLLPYAERTLQFTSRQEQTPRVKGLAAVAHSSKASYHYLLHHEPDTVVALYQRALELMQESDMMTGLPDLCANLGDAYVSKNNLPEASKWYRRAIVLVDSLELPASHNLTLYVGLGRIYTALRDFDSAREYYEMADKRLDELKPNMQSYFLNNYGNFFYFQHQYQQALATFKRLKAHLEQYDAEENFDMYLCKINIADVYLNLNQLDSARHYVDEAEEYFKRQGVDDGVFYAHTIRIGIAIKQKQYAEVRRILKEESNLHVNDVEMTGIRNRYMNQYYAAIGDYQKAYAGLRINIEQQDPAEYDRNSMRASDIMTRLTEDTIRLHHQLLLNEQKAKYARNYMILWALLGLLTILVLLFVLWFIYDRKRRLQNHLDMLMLRMANARQRISPHFVFNVLNSRITKTDQQEADQLMTLAKLIRSNLDMAGRTYVSLAEELDFVQQYVEIERSLIGEEFDFRIETPMREELEKVMIPSMFVQILTENAILHGLKSKEGSKQLRIKVAINEQETRIAVIDNGNGFDVRQYNGERSRTGLAIIRSTLNAINQRNRTARMQFDIKNDHGCHTILTIPKNIKLI